MKSYKQGGFLLARKTIALSVDDRIYNQYKGYCQKQGIILSKQVEKFMEKELKNNGVKDE